MVTTPTPVHGAPSHPHHPHPKPTPMKPTAPPLPAGTFVARDKYDPLVHSTQDLFWYHIEPFFNPITEEDIKVLEPTVPPVPEVPPDGSAVDRSDPPQLLEDKVLSRVQSFPITHRLNAAFLDEGKGEANAAKSIRSGLTAEETWTGGPPSFIKEYNDAYEERVRDELGQLGLLDPSQNCQILTEIRKTHWHMRNVAAKNKAMKSEISEKVMTELREQSNRREKKVKENQIEIKYLESMMEKGGKRGKGRFAKLLNQMHPNRNLLPGDPIQINKPGSSSFDDKPISKKRKKKQAAKERSAPKKQHHVDLEKTLHIQKVA